MKSKFKFKKSIFIILILSIFLLVFLYSKSNSSIISNFSLDSKDKIHQTAKVNFKSMTSEWTLTIPKIGLVSIVIKEGTSPDVLNEYIGHFETTKKESGNIGLAAHNRGYKVNYFENVKELEIGDYIIYTYQGKSKKYKVIIKENISSYDWSYLQETLDNRITLITCIDNRPDLRLCVQAVESKED